MVDPFTDGQIMHLLSLLGSGRKRPFAVEMVLTESPVGVEYSLTKLSETLQAPVAALCQWTSKHSAAVRDAQKSFDAKKVTHKSNPSG
jgi:DNA-binding HxlR family transcriptional regulator